nr:MAG TPA: hypothetical protein [Caudoviricetes sp.]
MVNRGIVFSMGKPMALIVIIIIMKSSIVKSAVNNYFISKLFMIPRVKAFIAKIV